MPPAQDLVAKLHDAVWHRLGSARPVPGDRSFATRRAISPPRGEAHFEFDFEAGQFAGRKAGMYRPLAMAAQKGESHDEQPAHQIMPRAVM